MSGKFRYFAFRDYLHLPLAIFFCDLVNVIREAKYANNQETLDHDTYANEIYVIVIKLTVIATCFFVNMKDSYFCCSQICSQTRHQSVDRNNVGTLPPKLESGTERIRAVDSDKVAMLIQTGFHCLFGVIIGVVWLNTKLALLQLAFLSLLVLPIGFATERLLEQQHKKMK
uniref:Copper transporter n=1 Tax=Rhabditophanes sp. KR3021 TaxID=114890 RepID=A0AC35U9Y8_9BILA